MCRLFCYVSMWEYFTFSTAVCSEPCKPSLTYGLVHILISKEMQIWWTEYNLVRKVNLFKSVYLVLHILLLCPLFLFWSLSLARLSKEKYPELFFGEKKKLFLIRGKITDCRNIHSDLQVCQSLVNSYQNVLKFEAPISMSACKSLIYIIVTTVNPCFHNHKEPEAWGYNACVHFTPAVSFIDPQSIPTVPWAAFPLLPSWVLSIIAAVKSKQYAFILLLWKEVGNKKAPENIDYFVFFSLWTKEDSSSAVLLVNNTFRWN